MDALALGLIETVGKKLTHEVGGLFTKEGIEVLVLVGVLAGVLAVVLAVVRAVMIRRALARRISWEVVPFDEFDPSAEEIEQFARKLMRCWGVLKARFLRPAAAVRFELRRAGDSRMVLVVSAPGESRAVVRSAALHRTELREVPRDGG